MDSAICHPLFLAAICWDPASVRQSYVTACNSMRFVCYFPGIARIAPVRTI